MESARRVDDDDLHPPRDPGLDPVERDAGGIGARRGADDLGAGARGPDRELLARRGTEGIGGDDERRLARVDAPVGELSDRGRLPDAVDPTDENDARPGIRSRGRGRDRPAQRLGGHLAKEIRDARGVFDPLVRDLLLQRAEQILRRPDPDVSPKEHLLQLVV